MAQKTTGAGLQTFFERSREEIYAGLCSRTGELISALQAREVVEAQQIAAQLHQDLRVCESDRPSYFLAQILTLLYFGDAFLHCDELSVWLLALESELNRLRLSSRVASLFPPMQDSHGSEACSVSGTGSPAIVRPERREETKGRRTY